MRLKYIPRTVIALCTVSLVAGLAACSGNDDSAAVVTVTSDVTTTAPTTTGDAQAETTADEEAPAADEPAAEETGEDTAAPDNGLPAQFAAATDGVDGAYQYALVDITGDGAPELLLREDADGVGTITVFTSDGTKVPTTFQDGAGPDGETYSVAATTDGTGLLTTETPAGLGTTTTVRWEMSGGYLQRTDDEWTSLGMLVPPELTNRQAPVNWVDATAPGGSAESGNADGSAGTGSGEDPDQSADEPSGE